MPDASQDDQIARYADMMAALGTETRLRIVRLLLSAHPYGLVVGEIGSERVRQVGDLGSVGKPIRWRICTVGVYLVCLSHRNEMSHVHTESNKV